VISLLQYKYRSKAWLATIAVSVTAASPVWYNWVQSRSELVFKLFMHSSNTTKATYHRVELTWRRPYCCI